MKNTFNYSDSEAGMQTENFNKLSEIIKHIEDFESVGNSSGVIYQNETPILEYVSDENGIKWISTDLN